MDMEGARVQRTLRGSGIPRKLASFPIPWKVGTINPCHQRRPGRGLGSEVRALQNGDAGRIGSCRSREGAKGSDMLWPCITVRNESPISRRWSSMDADKGLYFQSPFTAFICGWIFFVFEFE
jgi:hypothetical protein